MVLVSHSVLALMRDADAQTKTLIEWYAGKNAWVMDDGSRTRFGGMQGEEEKREREKCQ